MLFNESHLECHNDLSVPHRGIVLKNRDPKKLGRIKCMIPGIFDDSDVEKLPWISRWSTDGGNIESGSVKVPECWSVVIIEFKNNDIYSGFYTGVWESTITSSGMFNNPDTSGYQDSAGNTFIQDSKQGYSEIRHPSGTVVRIDRDGEVTIKSKKILCETPDGQNFVLLDEDNNSAGLAGKDLTELSGPLTRISSKKFEVNSEQIFETGKVKTSSITGGVKEKIGGSKNESIAGDYSKVVTGMSEGMFVQKMSSKYGMGYEEIIATIGIVQRIIMGVVDVTLVTGSETHTIGLGSFGVNVGAGSINLKTKAGVLEFGNLLGKLAVGLLGELTLANKTGSLSMNMTGTVLEEKNPLGVQIKAMKLALGQSPQGFILTSVSDPIVDTISGMPHIGVPTITAG